MITFYQDEHYEFFYTSIAIISFSQVAYVMTFIVKYSTMDNLLENFGLFLSLLLVSPFLSFLFMIIESNDESSSNSYNNDLSVVAKFVRDKIMCCFKLDLQPDRLHVSVDKDDSKLKRWMKAKINRHIGFILEAACMYCI